MEVCMDNALTGEDAAQRRQSTHFISLALTPEMQVGREHSAQG